MRSKVVLLVASCSLSAACAATSNDSAPAIETTSSSTDASSTDASTSGAATSSETGTTAPATTSSSDESSDETGAPIECAEGDGLCVAIDDDTERCFCPQPIAAPFPGADVVHTADVDGDSFVDVIANHREADEGPSTLWIWRGSTDGFAAHVELGAQPGWATRVVSGDLDEDGVLDLVTGSLIETDLFVWTSAGAALPTTLVTLEHPETDDAPPVELGDFDGDAHLDLATLVHTEPTTMQVAIWPGRGDGSFDAPVLAELGDGYVFYWNRIAAVDLDGDAVDDVITLGHKWMRGIPAGAGTLGPIEPTDLFAPAALADVDGDGHVDALEIGYGVDHVPDTVPVTVALGSGEGVFTNAVTWEFPGDEEIDARFAQLDEDGALDLVFAAGPSEAQHLLLARGDGSGGFATTPSPSRGTLVAGAEVIAVEDLTADGRTDVLVRSRSGSRDEELLLYVAQP